MKQIVSISEKIRDHINNNNLYEREFNKSLDKWNSLCVALDTLEDTSLALKYFEEYGKEDHDDIGKKYLEIYGSLQSVFLQQDSIRVIYKVLSGNDIPIELNSSWEKIRKIRNLTIGHPLEYSRKKVIKRCFISRGDIQKNKLKILVWNNIAQKDEFEDIEFDTIYNGYKSEALNLLQMVYNHIRVN